MSTKLCPKCERPLLRGAEGKIAEVKPGQSVAEAPGTEWETYTCQTRSCPYYNQALVWDKSESRWRRLPDT